MSTFWTVARQLFEALESSLESSAPVAEPEIRRGRMLHRAKDNRAGSLGERTRTPQRPADRVERIRSEIFMVAPHFSQHEGVNYDEANCAWLEIPKLPLPSKWRSRWCRLLILFPESYPLTPPIGFYLNREFRLKDGGTDGHLIGRGLHNAPDLRDLGWFWYCVSVKEGVQGGWRPSARYDQPDNLRTFLNTVREVLTND